MRFESSLTVRNFSHCERLGAEFFTVDLSQELANKHLEREKSDSVVFLRLKKRVVKGSRI